MEPGPTISCEAPPARPPVWVWVCLALAAGVLVLFRLHAFDLPLETDECNYAYIGAQLWAGDRLYVDLWDHQPWGVFALFGGVSALFGSEPEVFRLFALGSSLVSLVLVFVLCARVAGWSAAAGGALLFALASADPGTAGEGCNRELYMNPLILAAWCLALRPVGRGWWNVVLAGAALGLASTLKTIVALHWLLLAVWLMISVWQDGPRRVRAGVGMILAFGLAPALIWGGTCVYFALTDRFGLFWDAVFTFNLSYSGSTQGFWSRFASFFTPARHPFIFDSALALWVGGLAAQVALLLVVVLRRNSQALALLLLTLASYLAICLPMHFWPHYYYLLIPVLAVGFATALKLLADLLESWVPEKRMYLSWAVFVVFGAFTVWLAYTEYHDYLSQPPFGITVKRYNSRDFWGRAQGENIRRVTDPGDTIFVYGNEAEIYYYAQRRCASRFTMITGISEGYAGVEARREIMMQELEAAPPRLILVVFDQPPFPRWRDFLHAHYDEPVGWDIRDDTDHEGGTYRPFMFVLARRDAPIAQINWNWDRTAVGGWLPQRGN